MSAVNPHAVEMSPSLVKANLNALANAVVELQAAIASIRTDLLAHDHGGAYAATTYRANVSVDTVTGTVFTNVTTTVVPNPILPDDFVGN